MTAEQEARLHAYYDGELSGFARWRFERELRRSAPLQRELDALKGLGSLLREQDAVAATPDLWDSIALGLPAADARRTEAETSAGGLGWWIKPLGAVAATAAVAVAFLYGGMGTEVPMTGGVVRWIDSGDRGVMVFEDDPESTLIWVMDDVVEGATLGGDGGLT